MKVAGLFGSMSLTPSGPSAEPMFVAHKCARIAPAAQVRVLMDQCKNFGWLLCRWSGIVSGRGSRIIRLFEPHPFGAIGKADVCRTQVCSDRTCCAGSS